MEAPDSLTLRIRRQRFPAKALCISRYSCSLARKRFVYPSLIVTINREKATSYLENWSQFRSLQDRDVLYINVFHELAQVSLCTPGSGMGTFTGGGRDRWLYLGTTTELGFVNGTKVTYMDFAKLPFHLPASRAERVFTSCRSLLPQALQPAKMPLLPIRHRQHLQPQPVLQLQGTHHRLPFR